MLKPNTYYAGYNTLTKEVLPDTLYRHRADTADIMISKFGEDWEESRPYLTVTTCEVVIIETED